MLGDSALAQKFSKRLFEENVFAVPIVFPMVARDKARVRNIVTAGRTRKGPPPHRALPPGAPPARLETPRPDAPALVRGVHREAVDPALAGVVGPEDGAHEAVPVERAQVEAVVQPDLARERPAGVPNAHAVHEAPAPPPGGHPLVVVP